MKRSKRGFRRFLRVFKRKITRKPFFNNYLMYMRDVLKKFLDKSASKAIPEPVFLNISGIRIPKFWKKQLFSFIGKRKSLRGSNWNKLKNCISCTIKDLRKQLNKSKKKKRFWSNSKKKINKPWITWNIWKKAISLWTAFWDRLGKKLINFLKIWNLN